MVLVHRAFDLRTGFLLAYYRTFTTPESAAQVVKSGEILRDPQKRTFDTAIIIYEIVANGLDSDRGRAAIAIMNRAHEHVRATNEEFLYVLLALLVVPTRWVAAHGLSPLTDDELAASVRFYRELGERMHLTDLPTTYEEASAFFEDFEERRVAPSADIFQLFDLTVGVFRGRMPRAVRPLVRPVLATMMEDARVNAALGLRPPPRLFRRLVFLALAIRARLPQPTRAEFTPGRAIPPLYPDGYSLDEIGPRR